MLDITMNEDLDLLKIEDLRYRPGDTNCPTASLDSYGCLYLHSLSVHDLRKLAEVCTEAADEIEKRDVRRDIETLPLPEFAEAESTSDYLKEVRGSEDMPL